jgi:long-chain acyl-CoA synthetase
MTLSDLLTQKAKSHPSKTCIKFESRGLSYSEIDSLATLYAGGLVSAGLESRDRVAILMENCPEYIILYFSIIRAGGIVIPLNTFLTSNEVSYILKDSGCKILLYSGKYAVYIEDITNKCDGIKCISYERVPQSEFAPEVIDENDTAALLYTSGTTGFPKGVMLSHRNLLSNAEACIQAMNVSHKDRVLLFLPLFHAFSFTVCVVLPICAGASIVLLASVKPFSKVVKSIVRDRITLFVAVPTVYNILSKKNFSSFAKLLMRILVKVRLCFSGASALPETTLREFEKRFSIPLIEGYGLTEASPVISVNPLNGPRKPASVGLPIPGVEISVIGEDGAALPQGEIGELIVKGPNVMQGYYNRLKETSDVLRNGWLYTGDLVKIDEDGYIFIMDRKKDLIIVDGMNIYPREIEDHVSSHPSVDECAMVGVPDEKGSELTCLYIKKYENADVSEKEIHNFLQDKIARFKAPKRIRFIEEFPKTATGKIKKSELKKWRL